MTTANTLKMSAIEENNVRPLTYLLSTSTKNLSSVLRGSKQKH